jgi:plastocyanin
MNNRPRPAAIALVFLVLLVAAVPSCGGDKGTNPVGGAKELDSGNIAGGGTQFQHMFAAAGTYGYHCQIHGTAMSGSVTVAASNPANVAVTIGDNFYNPSSVAVAPGGTVTWTNNGSTHTVTSN